MSSHRRILVSAVLAGSVATGLLGVASSSRIARAGNGAIQLEEHKTRADHVRDVRELLKKAAEELRDIDVNGKGHDAAAAKNTEDAIKQCDEYLKNVGAGKSG